MRNRNDPWKWPCVIALTVSLWLAGLFLLPRNWIDFVFAPSRHLDLGVSPEGGKWLSLLPPPEIIVLPDNEPRPLTETEPPPAPVIPAEPQWWTDGMRVRIVEATPGRTERLRPTLRDTVDLILHELGIVKELTMFAEPDSVVATALLLLAREDALRFDALKPYFSAVARSRDFADVMSRAADMYGDFLQQEIMVPD